MGQAYRWQAAGIIPAYAGSTSNGVTNAVRTVGSSPHTRGALNADNA